MTRDPVVRVSVAALVLLLAAMVAAIAPAPPATTPTVEPIASAVAACPGGTGAVAVTAVSVSPSGPGRLELAPLSGVVAAESNASTAPLRVADAGAVPLIATATAGAAPGFTVEQSNQVDAGPARGLAAGSCAVPGTRFWFAGGAAAVGRTTELVLVNPDRTPASADVSIFGPTGPIEAPAGTGVVVPASGRTTLRLDALATGLQVAAVTVQARTGRVAAALWEQQVSGGTRQGVDWVAPSVPPATDLIVPGVFADASATLILAAPGERQAVARVELLGAGGTFTPVGLDAVSVPAGSTAAVPLDAALAGAAVAVRVTSDEPLVAGVRLVRNVGGREFGYAASTPPLVEAAAAELPPGISGQLMLAAPGAAAEVVVSAVAADGTRTSRRVAVPAGGSVVLPLPATTTPASVVVSAVPGSGPVHAARQLAITVDDVGWLSVTPLLPRATTVTIPATVADPAVGIPGH